MPHKRAKRSIREQQQKERGFDLPPKKTTNPKSALDSEAIPKAVSRVLNATKIRGEWNEKKRKNDGEDDGRAGKRLKTDNKKQKAAQKSDTTKPSRITIQPGESLQHFNKRVEDDMRPLVRNATKSSLAVERSAKSKSGSSKSKSKSNDQDEDDEEEEETPPPSRHANRPKEFQTISTSAPRRLNDIALAPPEFKKVPKTTVTTSRKDGGVSMAQKAMMEVERERVIAHYRQLKAKRRAAGDDGHALEDGDEE
ncbi:hypothetical protein C8J56DRAFT_994139 [Mycena floridula]|nr:hypothetical protein C8J56DRAFT_994139 [Mycena floridula]